MGWGMSVPRAWPWGVPPAPGGSSGGAREQASPSWKRVHVPWESPKLKGVSAVLDSATRSVLFKQKDFSGALQSRAAGLGSPMIEEEVRSPSA